MGVSLCPIVFGVLILCVQTSQSSVYNSSEVVHHHDTVGSSNTPNILGNTSNVLGNSSKSSNVLGNSSNSSNVLRNSSNSTSVLGNSSTRSDISGISSIALRKTSNVFHSSSNIYNDSSSSGQTDYVGPEDGHDNVRLYPLGDHGSTEGTSDVNMSTKPGLNLNINQDLSNTPQESRETSPHGSNTPVPISHPGASSSTKKPGVSCHNAKIRCALRGGCGSALQSYILDCGDLIEGRTTECDVFCQASLIGLLSTEEGEQLMDCECFDDLCMTAKHRLEVCRKDVLRANARGSVVSCNIAQVICSADASCFTALNYYDKYCKQMFEGRDCSFKCNNSIAILRRQAKAQKLETCLCDGTESFPCERIKGNMAKLCFPPPQDDDDLQEIEEKTNEIAGSGLLSKGSHLISSLWIVSLFIVCLT